METQKGRPIKKSGMDWTNLVSLTSTADQSDLLLAAEPTAGGYLAPLVLRPQFRRPPVCFRVGQSGYQTPCLSTGPALSRALVCPPFVIVSILRFLLMVYNEEINGPEQKHKFLHTLKTSDLIVFKQMCADCNQTSLAV